MQYPGFIHSLRSVAKLGVPLRRFVYPNLIMIVLEVVSLYMLAKLLAGVLATAAGASIDLGGATVLAGLLVLKSFANGALTKLIYNSYAENEIVLRRYFLGLARGATSRTLRSRSVETVTHEVNVYPANLTYNVYQQAVKLLSDGAIASAIMIALVVSNPKLTGIVILLFGAVACLIAYASLRKTAAAGRVTDHATVRLVNLLGRFLGARNEIAGSSIESAFQKDIDETNRALSQAHTEINYVALVPRFVLDGVTGLAIIVVVALVTSGVARLTQKDLAFSLAACLKLAPYLTSIIAGVMQISFSKAIVDGFNRSTRGLVDLESEGLVGVSVELMRNAVGMRLEIKAQGKSVAAGAGDILLIKGRSGSGKTTIAELIADVAEGRVAPRSEERQAVAYCSQFATVLDKTVRENVADESASEERVSYLLERYGLAQLNECERLNENTLSGGERQRVGIVRALNQKSEVFVFDEPTASIGALYAAKICEDVQSLASRGALVVLISHDSTFDSIASSRVDLS